MNSLSNNDSHLTFFTDSGNHVKVLHILNMLLYCTYVSPSKALNVPCKTFLLNAGHQTGGTIDYQTLGSQGKGVAVCQTPRFHTFQMFKLNFISVVIHNGSITPSLS